MSAIPHAAKPSVAELDPLDLYNVRSMLSDEERLVQDSVGKFVDEKVIPIIGECFEEERFPRELVPTVAEMGLLGSSIHGYGCAGLNAVSYGLICQELERGDSGLRSFVSVQSSLCMYPIYAFGSEEQKQKWLPRMARGEVIGCFGLTEPHGGSDVAGGMETTARRDGDEWVLNGAKRWIGNATFADVVVVWARDVETNRVLGFVVEKGTPGFTATKIENKFALRIVQKADIVLDECRISEANRLQNANSFRDTAEILRRTRSGVAWQAVGVQFAAYEIALQYATERTQFGRPIGKFQMVQDLLVKMLGNATACAGMMVRLAQLQHDGVYRDEQSALAKAYCTSRMRETVHWARELLGGNGIVLDYNIGRFVADSEALYSYEGTREMQTLIVGKSVTGLSAFV